MPFINIISAPLISAPALWSPLDLGGELWAWYDFSLLTGSDHTQLGSSVTIPDQSGNGRNAATPAGSSHTPYLETAEQNGLNVIHMESGSGAHLELPNSFYSGATEASCYFVLKADDESAGASQVIQVVGGGAGDLYPWGGGNMYHAFCSTTQTSAGNPTGSLATWRILNMHSKASDKGIYLDGISEFSSGTNTVKTDAVTNTISYNNPSNNFTGLVGEIIYTNAKQTTLNRQKTEGYLAWRWGLEGNLDAGHPYKSSPP